MNALTVLWIEAGQTITHTLHDQQLSKHPGTVRLGRDPGRCDLVLQHPTVSGLHIEIFFQAQDNCFQVRNLRESNPAVIDGVPLIHGVRSLQAGSIICLGQVEVRVTQINLASPGMPLTVLLPPTAGPLPPTPVLPALGVTAPAYGLVCPRCQHVSEYDQADLGCPWCGTSLAAAVSVLLAPNS